jgi:hypothetical protein
VCVCVCVCGVCVCVVCGVCGVCVCGVCLWCVCVWCVCVCGVCVCVVCVCVCVWFVCVYVFKYLYFMNCTINLKVYGYYPLLRGQYGLAGVIIRLKGLRQKVRSSIRAEINPSGAGSKVSGS